MKKQEYKRMMRLGRKLFAQENKRFNGVMRFAYLRDDETEEMLFFVPDGQTAERVKTALNTEFARL